MTQFLHHSLRVWTLHSTYIGRGSGTYINPDHFAAFLELVLSLPLAFLMAGRVGVITRLLLGYATLVIMAGLVVTLPRGGMVAATAGLLMLFGFLLCHKNHALRALLVLLVFLAIGGWFTSRFLSTNVGFMRRVLNATDTPGEFDVQSRMTMWTAAVKNVA